MYSIDNLYHSIYLNKRNYLKSYKLKFVYYYRRKDDYVYKVFDLL